jgi:hypothetical protein
MGIGEGPVNSDSTAALAMAEPSRGLTCDAHVLLAEIREIAERPTVEEMRARLASRAPVALSVEPALAVRAERDRA